MPNVDSHAPGQFCWVELATTDQAAARTFYRSLFGWEADEQPMGPGETYTLFRKAGRDVAAGYRLRPDQKGVPPSWQVYVLRLGHERRLPLHRVDAGQPLDRRHARDPEGLGRRAAALAHLLPGGGLRRGGREGPRPGREGRDGAPGLPGSGPPGAPERPAGRCVLCDPAERRGALESTRRLHRARPKSRGHTPATGPPSAAPLRLAVLVERLHQSVSGQPSHEVVR